MIMGFCDEPIVEPCEFCGSKNYDYLLKDKDGDIFGCDDCVRRVYVGEGE
jgi:hypothetical protein